MRSRVLALLALICVLIIIIFMTPAFFMGEAFKGRIIDEATGKPVQGAVVVASWPLQTEIGGFHPSTITTINIEVMEAVTDHNGYFMFPAWGPKLNTNLDAMRSGNPFLLVFKRGYLFNLEQNLDGGRMKPRRWQIVQRSDWNGKMILLKPNNYENDPTQYQFSGFQYLHNMLEDVVWTGVAWEERERRCYAERVSNMIAEYSAQRSRYVSLGIDPKIYNPIDRAVEQDVICKNG